MDVIHICLSLAPVPYLSQAFSLLRLIWSTVKQVEASDRQLRHLTQCIAHLLQTLNDEYRAGRLVEAKTSSSLNSLERLLNEISAFVHKEVTYGFLKSLYMKDDRITKIEEFHRRISAAVSSFQISALLSIQYWQLTNDSARAEDQRILDDRLTDLEANQSQLKEVLGAQHNSIMAMMVSMQKHLNQHSSSDQEYQFLSHSLRFLSTSSGSQVLVEDWMITSFEVDFGAEIGSGGFGRVHKGNWHKMEVALKVLKSESGVIPNSKAIRREVSTWSKIRHPHILQFLGANVLDDNPFIVMPYLKNGNARDYIQDHPDCERLKILYHVSLGLVYLHSQNIIHGDLKALNVLIDDSGKALLCDFGLSRVKADVTNRSTAAGEFMLGSRNWMAPEQLIGGSLRKPCDIYAFGMTIYEIYADETPLVHISYMDFIELVVRQDVRPERPYPEEAPGLSDSVWQVAEQCWVKEPDKRPNANAVCDIVSNLYRIDAGAGVAPPLPKQAFSQPDPPTLPPGPSSLPVGSVNLLPVKTNPMSNRTPKPKIETAHWAGLSPKSHVIKHTSEIYSIAFSPDGRQIASGGNDKAVYVWNSDTGECIAGPFRGHSRLVWSVAYSPDGKLIASGSADATVRVWNIATGKCISIFQGHTGLIRSVTFSPDMQWIASGSFDNTIHVWDMKTGSYSYKSFKGHTSKVYSVAFSPDGQWIASGSEDKTIRVWDVKTGKCILPPFMGHTDLIWSIAFSPDGQWIVSGSSDKTVRVWDVRTGRCVSEPFVGHTSYVLSVAVSPDNQWIVSGSTDKMIYIWGINNEKLESQLFPAHTDMIWSVAFSPDGQSIASGSNDRTIHTWACN